MRRTISFLFLDPDKIKFGAKIYFNYQSIITIAFFAWCKHDLLNALFCCVVSYNLPKQNPKQGFKPIIPLLLKTLSRWIKSKKWIVEESGGLRKSRWKLQGHGKRGGVRVIYYWAVSRRLLQLAARHPEAVLDAVHHSRSIDS